MHHITSTAKTRPPVIGICGASTGSNSVIAMAAQVRAMGGIPMLLANHTERDPAADIEKIDGLFVMGSDFDIDPRRYIDRYPEGDPRRTVHPETKSQSADPAAAARAAYEEKIINLAKDRRMPALLVCGGMHAANVMLGGGLLQHIPDYIGDNHHDQRSLELPASCAIVPVNIVRDTKIGAIAGAQSSFYKPGYHPAYAQPQGTIGVDENSFHHQAIDPDCLGAGLRIAAFSDPYKNVQGARRYLPEAIEPDPNGPLKDWPMRGVQWHPEFVASSISASLIAASVQDAAEYAKHAARDANNDMSAAYIANLVSAKKPANFMDQLQAQQQQRANRAPAFLS